MLRQPAVAGRFYPSDPAQLSGLIREFTSVPGAVAKRVKACLMPHAGYVYSGPVSGEVFANALIPQRVIVLGVRHRPPGAPLAILSEGAWRTPLGDARIDQKLAERLKAACPLLLEDDVAHSQEHSLEVQIPFLQVLQPGFTFVPIALGSGNFDILVKVGEGLGQVLAAEKEEVLLLATSDLNHYEDDATTRVKDGKAIDQLLKMDARGLYDTCRREEISMCGLGPAVAMLTALHVIQAKGAGLIRYATSGEHSGDLDAVVGYAGMIFY